MIPLEFLQNITRDRGIKAAEVEVLFLSMSGASTAAIASQLDISEDLVRKRLSRIYIKFEIEGRGPVKLAKLQHRLLLLYQNHLASESSDTCSVIPLPQGNVEQQNVMANPVSSVAAKIQSPVLNQIDWGETIDVSVFYGRTEELAQLEQWILRNHSRLIAVLGIGGIGKTILLAKLTQQIQPYFDFVIWRSLRNAPPLMDLLADLLQFLSNSQETELPEKSDERITHLISSLNARRCLLILDDVQTILRSNDSYHRYLQGYEGYGTLFQRVAEGQHQSCLLLSSREQLKEIKLLEIPSRPVKSKHLEGLKTEEAKAFLREKGLKGEQYWQQFIEQYRGNPLEIKLVAATIQDIFNGDVGQFLKEPTTIVSALDILDDQFDRLSALEAEVMQYLAKQDRALSFQQLRLKIDKIGTSDLIEALESLGGRSLIEKTQTQETNELLFTLQPVVKKYVSKYHLSTPQRA